MSKDVDWNETGEGTRAIWSGELECFQDHASQMPVVLSVAYGYEDMDEWFDVALGKKKRPYLFAKHQSHYGAF